MDNKERKAQTAVGLEKEFRITIEIPLTVVGLFTQEVKAVNEEDARQRVLDMMRMKTNNQIVLDINQDRGNFRKIVPFSVDKFTIIDIARAPAAGMMKASAEGSCDTSRP